MFATYATNLNDDSFYPDQPRLPAQHCEDPCVEVAGQLHPRGRPSEVSRPDSFLSPKTMSLPASRLNSNAVFGLVLWSM